MQSNEKIQESKQSERRLSMDSFKEDEDGIDENNVYSINV